MCKNFYFFTESVDKTPEMVYDKIIKGNENKIRKAVTGLMVEINGMQQKMDYETGVGNQTAAQG